MIDGTKGVKYTLMAAACNIVSELSDVSADATLQNASFHSVLCEDRVCLPRYNLRLPANLHLTRSPTPIRAGLSKAYKHALFVSSSNFSSKTNAHYRFIRE